MIRRILWSVWIAFVLTSGWVGYSVRLRRQTRQAFEDLARKEEQAAESAEETRRREQERAAAEEARQREADRLLEEAKRKEEASKRQQETAQREAEKAQQQQRTWWFWGTLLGITVVGVVLYLLQRYFFTITFEGGLEGGHLLYESQMRPSSIPPTPYVKTSEDCAKEAKLITQPWATNEDVVRWMRECGQYRWMRR